jgi:hypothetical protein
MNWSISGASTCSETHTSKASFINNVKTKRAITNSSKPGDTILDGFGGSGTTVIAAEGPAAVHG